MRKINQYKIASLKVFEENGNIIAIEAVESLYHVEIQFSDKRKGVYALDVTLETGDTYQYKINLN